VCPILDGGRKEKALLSLYLSVYETSVSEVTQSCLTL